ncbi:SixA phosphatase family protein [Nitratireductor pacificus]|uniref:Phosphoglycerate mutase n=1 Tax=Nitratireductor pacificus pht-3B TaxID=391937 RepID=K2M705_9HYPH|nr:histidine phosphatase family protein [Nitratireductor pacificus]EKF17961.1 phosphoglycerate mutase [Nitratireductor pacificus pht-3B]
MPRLFLLRHAKAAWAAPGMSDFDRQLSASGIADAEALGRRMRQEGMIPEAVLCSTARRATQTLDSLAATLFTAAPPVLHDEELYSSEATAYVTAIRRMPPCNALLVVGHNPMIEDLAFELPRDEDGYTMRLAGAGFPTCGLAVLRFDAPLAQLALGTGRLEAFLKPERA